MDARSLVDRLGPAVSHVESWPAAPPASVDELPPLHRELLQAINGFTVQGGALRVFGVGRGDVLDLDWWNDEETWRFAWDDRVDRYVFFAESAWGDQYAYRRGDDGTLEPTVHFLEGTLLRAEVLAASFDEFAENELLRIAAEHYDPLTIDTLARHGPIAPTQHWTFVPSIALGGEESLDNIVRLRGQDAMTMAGDLASALQSSPPGSWPTKVEPWVDDHGRQRLGVEFDREL
jgi:hypothetical protein